FFGYDSEDVIYSAVHDAFYTYMNGPVEDGGSEKGVVRESTDGRTWTTRGRLPADIFGFVGRLAAGEDGSLWGLMHGGQDTTAFGAVYRSMDRGATWEVAAQFNARDLVGNALDVEDLVIDWEGRVWVGCSEGERELPGSRGAVLRTVEPVAASAADEQVLPHNGLLQSIYPNPASGTVQVSVDVVTPQTVRLRIVDLLGREAMVLHDGPLRGARTFTVDTATWPTGTYIVAMETDARRETMRFTVVR
ncbi:MAG: T9SS type A sorting domain-containing protein, partial [Bacteroidota bacterium]